MFNQQFPLLKEMPILFMVILFVMLLAISKELACIFIFEIGYSSLLLDILPSCTLLGLSFLIAKANWID
jgi:hypothetical protein|tara:strand:- start:1858 stop:2064 length:207 start_codon:yes stop_codon:yes gene_type:complete